VVAEGGAYYLVNNKQHVFRLVIDAETFAHQASNVFAVRHGAGSKRLLLGAHYDAAPLTQGASDNAAGVSCILELARLLKDELPDVTLEFVAFDAEEYSVGDVAAGSGNYVKAHPDRKWDLLMNFDSVGMHFGEEFLHVGRSEQLPEFESIYRKLPIKNAGDDRSFDSVGVPVIWFNNHAKFMDFHTPLDSIETLDLDKIVRCIQEAVKVTEQLCR
jgi:Iap family predicted aminopeptidase